MEIWKSVNGYEGYYEISNLGNVRSLDRIIFLGNSFKLKRGKKLTINNAGSNYSHVQLSKNNKIKRKYIHRLVAEAFIPNPFNKKEVNHINENKRDNRVVNLEWATRQENINHSNIGTKNHNYKQEKHYETHPVTKTYFRNMCKEKRWNFEEFFSVDSGLRNKSNGSVRYYFVKPLQSLQGGR